MRKISPNDLCPCGSKIKYKKCCRHKHNAQAVAHLQRNLASSEQIENQQGEGRKIISSSGFRDSRFVAVGDGLFKIANTDTFHDFLARTYLPHVFGREWCQAELDKEIDDCHSVIQWFREGYWNLSKNGANGSGVSTKAMTGALFGYLHLSYSLYLLAHNAELQSLLIARLKKKDQFIPAVYETFVAAMFIKAGFDLEMENEQDGRTSHCEFTAKSKKTGEKFSVEAKCRKSGKENAGLTNQLYAALEKKANHTRVIFIEMNTPTVRSMESELIQQLVKKEDITIKGFPSEKAYVFVTNYSYLYHLKDTDIEEALMAHGYKIPDFNQVFGGTVRQIIESRLAHSEMFRLFKSVHKYRTIPSTFDGEIPEFAYNPKAQSERLLIGNSYKIPTPEGNKLGKLTTATVNIEDKIALGNYLAEDGSQYLVEATMTDEEIVAFRKHPNTFFGVPLPQGGKADTKMELFDFIYDNYKNSPRDALIRLLGSHPGLNDLPHGELVIMYLEMVMADANHLET